MTDKDLLSKAKDLATSALFKAMEERPPRQKAPPTGHMRERIAAAIHGAHPNFFKWEPADAYGRFLYQRPEMREMYEKWADDFLRCCDVLDLEVIDKRD